MSEPLRVLLLEDVPSDAELIERELKKTIRALDLRRVDAREEFLLGLSDFRPDLVLSDHALPHFNGTEALALVKQRAPDTPFIFVTGSLDEETAVECIKAGASDYVLKEHLVRLGPAVAAALELKRTREALHKSQEQLLHAQKMEAIGRLAGGIAHDFNNIMTAIIGYCELLSGDLAGDDPRTEDVDEIRKSAERAATLTRQLLAFSRRQVLELRPLNLNEVVANMDRMLRRLIGEDVELVTRLAADLGWLRSDPGQLEQVIVNLAVNARDAMPSGGKLIIETQNVTLDATYAALHPDTKPGAHVMLAVSDTGVGMTPETKARLFEPFFTTKEVGKGTGLGLATVYGIVRQSGGSIYVYSEAGRGATFKLYFPEIQPSAEQTTRAPQSVRAVTGTETVLLAEDEDTVRVLARKVLANLGYRVLEAPNGIQALALCNAHEGTIDLLVTDVVMPEMSGRDLAARVKERRPGIRVLYMSGYTDDAVVRHSALEEGMPYLQKPFTPQLLGRRVRETLDEG